MTWLNLLRTAWSGIAANKLRTALTMLGIIIGVASVIATLALGNGARAAVENSFRFLGSDQIQVGAQFTVEDGETRPAGKLLTYEDGLTVTMPDIDGERGESIAYFETTSASPLVFPTHNFYSLIRLEVTFRFPDATPETLVAMQKGWEETLGVTVQLEAVDPVAYMREQRKGSFQMLSDGWAADYPDLEDFTGKLFRSDSSLNYTQYKNTEVDALLQQARRETDRNKRYTLYAQAEQKILDDAPIIPIFWPVSHTLVKPCVQGYPNVSMTVPKYRYVDIVKP